MAPNMTITPTGVLFEDETLSESQLMEESKDKPKYVRRIVWRNVLVFSYLHLGAIYGVYLALTSAKLTTNIFAFFLYVFSGFGITAGAHRLWAHRSYKAKWPLKLLLMIMNTVAFQRVIVALRTRWIKVASAIWWIPIMVLILRCTQDAVVDWARDHRVHHKYSETDADPHNAKRGFFFSHVGWLLCRKHSEVKEKGKVIDLSDFESEPVLIFQKKYYFILMPLLCFILPTMIPVVCWNETWLNAYFVPTILRYVFTLNTTWLVNSAAHIFGNKPYDKYINPAQNKTVAIVTLGEGWHNYHHVFPWDYKTSEFGYRLNLTTVFINFFAMIGWAYDLKTVSENMVRRRVERTGDGSHEVWGWGDKDQSQEERKQAIITHLHSTKDQ